ncbi:DUF4181 domain-containing protein [Lentibacillus sp. Marseille-P4043]|uniref:DUF4181 domain-containing protein n=1 Tax=Lentibacillus sp. Marseille-P4043 TaxID=2040293 RepID=UPI000D0AF74E|nr:DUF4181 domain-containing protein [Lentibacillus sp. Marseille-P4043]
MQVAIVCLAFFLAIMNFQLSRWLFGEKRKKISETDGETIHRWLTFLLVCIGIGVYIFIVRMDAVDSKAIMVFLLCFLVVMYVFQAFMEWKYLQGSKQYVIPLILMVVGAACLLAIYFINDQMKYTTFSEVVSDQLNEETTVRSITIYQNDLTGDIPERKASAAIKDEEMLDRIVEDFSDMELKKMDGFPEYRKYRVRIVVTNQVATDHYSTESLTVGFNENYLTTSAGSNGVYEIVDGTDQTKTIESLVKSGEIDWEYYDE